MGIGCGPGSILTELTFTVPEDDQDAAASLTAIDVVVYRFNLGVCRNLTQWRREVCGGSCTSPPLPTSPPQARIRIERGPDGSYAATELPVLGDGPWELLATGSDEGGTAFLYGCRLVVSDSPDEIDLARPWCDVEVCEGQFHPACPVEVDCNASAVADPDGIGRPTCVPQEATVFAWEQNGTSCDPTGPGFTAPCRPAQIECETGRVTPVVDGVCPRAATTMCGATAADDLDCDGRFPGPCGTCVPGEEAACGTGACAPVATCGADGTYGDCITPPGVPEACGGGDEDCDGLDDADDPDALADCNAGRFAASPAADRCDGNACRCGSEGSCGPSTSCCGGACVDTRTSAEHCGGCGLACTTGVCRNGQCDMVLGTPCDVSQCNAGRDPRAPRADACFDDTCRCGAGPECEGGLNCCGGFCVETSCEPGAGSCTPSTERCNGVDDDCDDMPDSVDPDAVVDCNSGRPPGRPQADRCMSTGCSCGGNPICGDVTACCRSAGSDPDCVDVTRSNEHCGECGRSCDAGQACVSGVCS